MLFLVLAIGYIRDWIVEGRIICLVLAVLLILFPIVFFVTRKTIFNKVRLDDEGVAYTYKNQVLNEIKWEDVKSVSLDAFFS